jgi:hypothetical protein
MKKVLRKLVIRGETLRVLRTLDRRELARPVGGDTTDPVALENTESHKPICQPPTAAPG